jgi:hypothetical protein
MPVLVSLVIVVKPWVVLAMFSAKLLPALAVMRWMLIGDFFKGVSWVLAFPMLAYNEMRWFFWTEAVFNVALAIAAVGILVLVPRIEYLGAAFLGMYVCYLGAMRWYLRRKHGFRLETGDLWRFAGGLALVLGTSALTWSADRVSALHAAAWVLGAGAYCIASLRGVRLPSRGGAEQTSSPARS